MCWLMDRRFRSNWRCSNWVKALSSKTWYRLCSWTENELVMVVEKRVLVEMGGNPLEWFGSLICWLVVLPNGKRNIKSNGCYR